MTFIIPAIRGNDPQGRGYYGAPRGSRTHKGVDFVAAPGDPVRAFMRGQVSKLGYPYADKPEFRYVELARENGDRLRYFYVDPCVVMHQWVNANEAVGRCQELPYPGITQHYHFEVLVGGEYADPVKYLGDYA